MTRQFTVTTLLLVVFSTACAASASATPVWSKGESTVRLLTLPPKPAADLYGLTGKHLAVGYKYSYFGIMGVELWTWGGTYCLFEGNKYFKIPDAEANRSLRRRMLDKASPPQSILSM